MSKPVKKTARIVQNVGEFIEALQQFPKDMEILVELEGSAAVYQVKATKDDIFPDKRGWVKIVGMR